jgi:hypothetical protein
MKEIWQVVNNPLSLTAIITLLFVVIIVLYLASGKCIVCGKRTFNRKWLELFNNEFDFVYKCKKHENNNRI